MAARLLSLQYLTIASIIAGTLGAQMTHLTVRDLPVHVMAELRAQAAETHTSLSSIARAALIEYAERTRRRPAGYSQIFDEVQLRFLERHGGKASEIDSADL